MANTEVEIEPVVEVSVAKATGVMAPLAMSIKETSQCTNYFPLLVLSSFHLDLHSSVFNRSPSSSVFPNRDLIEVGV